VRHVANVFIDANQIKMYFLCKLFQMSNKDVNPFVTVHISIMKSPQTLCDPYFNIKFVNIINLNTFNSTFKLILPKFNLKTNGFKYIE